MTKLINQITAKIYLTWDFVTKVGYRRWKFTAKSRSTLIAVIVSRETVHTENPTIIDRWEMELFCVSRSPIYIGWPMTPTRKSETARLQRKFMDVERMDGVLLMAANTSALTRIEVSISGTFKRQIIVKIESGLTLSSLSEWWSADSLLSFPVSFILGVCVNSEMLSATFSTNDNSNSL